VELDADRWSAGLRPVTISDDDLDAIEARAASASAGPWESFTEARDHFSGSDFIRTGGMDNDSPDLYVLHTSENCTRTAPAAGRRPRLHRIGP
jgi:hypothetical protein